MQSAVGPEEDPGKQGRGCTVARSSTICDTWLMLCEYSDADVVVHDSGTSKDPWTGTWLGYTIRFSM